MLAKNWQASLKNRECLCVLEISRQSYLFLLKWIPLYVHAAGISKGVRILSIHRYPRNGHHIYNPDSPLSDITFHRYSRSPKSLETGEPTLPPQTFPRLHRDIMGPKSFHRTALCPAKAVVRLGFLALGAAKGSRTCTDGRMRRTNDRTF